MTYAVGYAVAVVGLALMLASAPTLVWVPVYAAGAAHALVPLLPDLHRQVLLYSRCYAERLLGQP